MSPAHHWGSPKDRMVFVRYPPDHLFSLGNDTFLAQTMKLGNAILDALHFGDSATAHRLIAGQVDAASKTKRIREALFPLFRSA